MEIVAVANQKGGCGKTTTAINLAACLGNRDKRVLLIDMDPQGHASLGLGQACEEREGLYEVFLREVSLQEVVIPEVAKGVDLVPGTISLAAVEHLLADTPEREWRLASHLASVAANYDYGVIDCPPSLGLLAFNALRAADRVVVPVDLSVFSLDGVARLNETIDLLAEKYNTEVSITVVPTMVDYRPRFSRDILRELRGMFPGMMSQAVIHSTVRLKEAAYRGVPVIHHAADSMGALDYDRLAREVMGEKVGRVTVSHFHAAGAAKAEPASQAPKVETPASTNRELPMAAKASGQNLIQAVAAAAGGSTRYEPVQAADSEKVERAQDTPRERVDSVSRFVRETLDRKAEAESMALSADSIASGIAAGLEQEIGDEIDVFLGSRVNDLADDEMDDRIEASTEDDEDAIDDRIEASAEDEDDEDEIDDRIEVREPASFTAGVTGFSMLKAEDRERLLATFGDGSRTSGTPVVDAQEEAAISGFRLVESRDEEDEADLLAAEEDEADEDDEELLAADEDDEELLAADEDDEELLAADEDDEELLAADEDDEELLAADEDDEAPIASSEPAVADPVIATSANAFARSVREATGGFGNTILARRSEAEPREQEVTLLFKGMSGKRVQLAGDFNGWIPDRGVYTRIQDGTLVKTMKLEVGEYQYRVVVDGIWQEDPGNPQRVANIYGGSNSLLRVDGEGERLAL